MTVFVFTVPLAMGRLRVAVPARAAIGVGLSLVAAGLLAMHGRSVGSSWEALLPGLVLAGVGIGLANRAIGATAIAVVHPSRAGMASGFNNACRLGGIAVGIAALGTVFEHRIAASFHGAGHAHLAAATVASAGTRAADAMPVAGRAAAAHLAGAAFISGLNELFLVGAGTVGCSAVAAFVLIRAGDVHRAAPEPAAATSGRFRHSP
ncbi:MAG TPA: hypothetical protein VE777_18855 [Gaiellales bacterium]|nr:hypothetical protein [Gaiellales bacterium]